MRARIELTLRLLAGLTCINAVGAIAAFGAYLATNRGALLAISMVFVLCVFAVLMIYQRTQTEADELLRRAKRAGLVD